MRTFSIVATALSVLPLCVLAQEIEKPNASWVGKRIVQLEGRGEIDVRAMDGSFRLGETNIVSTVDHVDADGVWVRSPAGVVGRIRGRAVLLEHAVAYFSKRLIRSSVDGDAYLRRADAWQALNQSEPALQDYSVAVRLNPDDWFLYMRRARLYNILKNCSSALADLEKASSLSPKLGRTFRDQIRHPLRLPRLSLARSG
jgi:tetratricopeptide (TPR) repeat protein